MLTYFYIAYFQLLRIYLCAKFEIYSYSLSELFIAILKNKM